ncbi:unnamed protein product, partial [Amoebophrya sp. A25]
VGGQEQQEGEVSRREDGGPWRWCPANKQTEKAKGGTSNPAEQVDTKIKTRHNKRE